VGPGSRQENASNQESEPREKTKFTCGIKLIWAVQSCLQKNFASGLTQINSMISPSRPTEGRLAIVTEAGRDAVDAAASGDARGWQGGSIRPVSERMARRRTALSPSKPLAERGAADGEVVWF